MELADLAAEEYVALTTYRTNGGSSSTPVWIAGLDGGRLGLITDETSLKVRRIRNDARVRLQPCNARGEVRPGTEPVDGRAEVVTGDAYVSIRDAIRGKYGWKLRLIGIGHWLTRVVKRDGGDRVDAAVVIGPPDR